MNYQDCNVLPEDCISTILSFTTPQDTCRSLSVSSLFHIAADSDVVWDKFLPSNYQYIISQSVSPIVFSSKKHLFFQLQNPTFIDHGNKMLSLERSTGKITCMLSAKELSIAGSDDPMEWIWMSSPESRFSDVAELRSSTRLEIKGKIRSNTLSPKTNYAAYLVMKLTDCSYGLDSLPSELSIEVRNKVSKSRAYLRRNDSKKQWLEQLYYSNRVQMLRSRVSSEGIEGIAQERKDGWMEIELGEFYNDVGNCEIKMSLMEVKGDQLKGGLVIEGIELRPKSSK
ncbi:F-box protein pp2-b15 [Thalictrum thalictroides]|uniref:F-box protein pp2-b15 n=1 Tax=Thalictrum thalictroides TaxID=46969 RepID=A0A7J6X9Q3_THATH|nr:F-box protein pp2-b15 [Thalictrum thalictroides]